MRKLLIIVFLVLTAVLAYFAWAELSQSTLREMDTRDTPASSVPATGELSPIVGSNNGDGPGISANIMSSTANFMIPRETEELRDKVFAAVETSIDEKHDDARELNSYAHNLGWGGSICSWLILAITVFLQNANSEPKNPKDEHSMPLKSSFIGVLAVGAAICPLGAGKLDENATDYREKADSLRVSVNEARRELGPQLDPKEWEILLHELEDETRE